MWFKKLAKLQQPVQIVFGLIVAIAILGLQNNRYQKVAASVDRPNYLEQETNLQAKLNFQKMFPSFGFDNLIADSLYLEFVQYFGDKTAREVTGYSLVTPYFQAIAQKDPQFTNAHLILATANSMYAGQAEQTVNLVDDILHNQPTETKDLHLLWSLKATDETLFLGNIQAAKHSYQQAAKSAQNYYQQNASAVKFNQQKARFLATNPETTETQIIAWKSVLPYVIKEKEKQVIYDRISALEAQLD